ncbi:MAG: Holliday junction branch migration protein RuvA [Candidatus Omnitrophota bacterium]|jgi:Holliday junction DNA helicase RuvA
MYQYLAGKLIEKTPTHLTLDVNGVGYRVLIPISTYAALPATTEMVRILTHLVVREDAHLLYGFATEEERKIFRLLLSVSGIGPKMATTILSGIPVPELKRAIAEGSLVVLTGISGIGKKTAERLIIELREKMVVEDRAVGTTSASGEGPLQGISEDAVGALVELGYRKAGAREAVQKAMTMNGAAKLSVSDLIRAALKYV